MELAKGPAMTSHVAVWIDHHDAKIYRITEPTAEGLVLREPEHHVRRHSGHGGEHHHASDDTRFFHEVAGLLASVDEILIVGPAKAKTELVNHITEHHRPVAAKIVGVETVDHPTDGQIVALARRYFRHVDKMLGTSL
jgi:stalled ribosome rescue protein Dom34